MIMNAFLAIIISLAILVYPLGVIFTLGLLWIDCDLNPERIKSKAQLLNRFLVCFYWPYLLIKPVVKCWKEIPDEEE